MKNILEYLYNRKGAIKHQYIIIWPASEHVEYFFKDYLECIKCRNYCKIFKTSIHNWDKLVHDINEIDEESYAETTIYVTSLQNIEEYFKNERVDRLDDTEEYFKYVFGFHYPDIQELQKININEFL